MFINNIDKLIDTILNNFNNYINELKIFKTIILTTNFVKYQKDIIIIIKNFINSIDKNNILTVIKKTCKKKIRSQTSLFNNNKCSHISNKNR